MVRVSVGVGVDSRVSVGVAAKRGIPEQPVTWAGGAGVLGDERVRVGVGVGHGGGMVDGIADGGRTADVLGCAVVHPAEAVEPAQHHRNVGAKDAPVGVDLVEGDIAHLREKPAPVVGGVGVLEKRLADHVGGHQQYAGL